MVPPADVPGLLEAVPGLPVPGRPCASKSVSGAVRLRDDGGGPLLSERPATPGPARVRDGEVAAGWD